MIQVIGRALDIIELIAQKPEKIWTLSEIANTLKLNHGTCANIIKTLVSRNYIEKKEEGTKGYRLGTMIFTLSSRKDNKAELMAAAQDEMERLTGKFNENTILSVLKGDQRVAILRVNSHNQLQAVTATQKEAFNSSTGKLLVAMLPDDELAEWLRRYGIPKTRLAGKKITRPSFENEIKKIRASGVATHLPDDEVFGIAVPIHKGEKVVASLSIYLPAYRYTQKLHRQMQQELLLSSRNISNKL